MKRVLSGLILIFAFVIVGCSSGETEQKNIVLSLGTQDNPGNPLYTGYEAFAEKLAELSAGTMTVEIFPSSQLGTSKETFDQVITGELDMATAGYPDMSYIIPELILVGQVYVVRDYEHLLKIIDSEYGQMIDQKFADLGVHVAGVWYSGVRQTTSNRPLNSISDFQGLKLRTPQVEALITFTEATGASASPIAFSELYLALQTGQVEAQENPLSTIESQKIYEVQDYLAITDHFLASAAVFINEEKYNSFTDEQKAWFNEAVAYGGQITKDIIEEEESSLLDKFQNEYGITITYPDLQAFRDAMIPYYAKLEAEYGQGAIKNLMDIQ